MFKLCVDTQSVELIFHLIVKKIIKKKKEEEEEEEERLIE